MVSLFQVAEETIYSAEINDTSYESHADFHWEKTKENFLFEKPNNQKPKTKKCHFPIVINLWMIFDKICNSIFIFSALYATSFLVHFIHT